jgi:hypothetical protein
MNKNAKRFASFVTTFGTTALLGSLLMVGGCGGGGGGGDSAPATTTKTTAIPAGAVNVGAGNTLTTVQAVTATPTGSSVEAIRIPVGVVITPPAGTTYTASTTIGVTTFNGVSALPAPLTTGYTVDSTAGAVDVKIGDVNGATFSAPVTIKIPLTGTVTSCEVHVNKGTGAGYVNLGLASNSATCNTDGFATITVTNLCTFVVNPHFTNGATGSTGSTGGGTGF